MLAWGRCVAAGLSLGVGGVAPALGAPTVPAGLRGLGVLPDSVTGPAPQLPPAKDVGRSHVTGTVLDADTEMPVDSVRIQPAGTSESVHTSPSGEYTLDLAPGTYALRFTRRGYKPLTLVVLVAPDASCIVDVGLERLASPLPAVRVHSERPGIVAEPDSSRSIPRRTSDWGTVWSRTAMRESPHLDQSDVLHLVETAPTTATHSEEPLGLHVDGGMADQNLVLLDGIPIENAVHAGVISSAINPAAIATTTLYDDYTPARFGGRLAGIIDLQSRGPSPRDTGDQTSVDPFQLEGSAGYGDLALLAVGEHPATGAFGLVSVRHSPKQLGSFWARMPRWTDVSDLEYGAGWSDVLARGVVPVAGGELAALGFQSQDVARFSAPGPFWASEGSGFAWRSSAFGTSWTGPVPGMDRVALTLRAWQAGVRTEERAAGNHEESQVINWLDRQGVSADVRIARHVMTMHIGGTLEGLRSWYRAGEYSSDSTAAISSDSIGWTGTSVTLVDTILRATTYTDVEWRVTPRWTLFPGLRVTYEQPGSGRASTQMEPRLGAVVAMTPRLRAAAFYTRTTQPLQSLRNEEAALDGVAALDLMSVRSNRIPEPTSHLLSGTLTLTATPALTVAAGAYDRVSSHLLMVPTSTTAPFVVDSVATGSGHAAGWYLTMTRATRRLVADATYRSESALLRGETSDEAYRPSFAQRRASSFALRYRPVRRTELRASFDANMGRRAALTQGSLIWGWNDHIGGNQAVVGTAETTNPGSVAIPSYSRLDLGASYELLGTWHCDGASHQAGPLASGAPCGRAAAQVFVALHNVFDRPNVGAVVQPTGSASTTQPLTLRPRTLVFGLQGWW